MRIAICDDDENIRNKINKYLHDFLSKSHLKCPEIIMFEDGESLLKDSLAKDIVFLDVEMPGLKGIYVGKELRKANKNTIIFIISAFSEYLDDAMLLKVASVRIIHGKGTGLLRKHIWNMLKKDRRVASYRMGTFGEGDAGVTVVELKIK